MGPPQNKLTTTTFNFPIPDQPYHVFVSLLNNFSCQCTGDQENKADWSKVILHTADHGGYKMYTYVLAIL
jgi:hypothetical protein